MTDLTLLQQLDQLTDEISEIRDNADPNDTDILIGVARLTVKVAGIWATVVRAEADTLETEAMEAQFGPSAAT